MKLYTKIAMLVVCFVSVTKLTANTPVLSSDGILSITGESGVMEHVTIELHKNESEIILNITKNNVLNSYQYSLNEVTQFRFVSKEHMDTFLKSNNVPIYVEMIHKHESIGRTQEMEAMFNLVKYRHVTHTSVQSGNWSDPATWGGEENIPLSGARVLIESGHIVTVDTVIKENYKTIRVDGTLRFATDVDTAIKVNTMVVNNMSASSEKGKFEMGTEINPIQKGVRARLIIDKLFDFETEDASSPDYDPHKLGLGLIAHGTVTIYGDRKTGYGVFNGVESGVKSITLDEVPHDWEVGDHIVIAGTQRDALGDEARYIAGIAGNTISFKDALEKDHTTPIHTKEGLTLKVHVINTTRNAIIETANNINRVEKIGSEFLGRGHIMFMHTNDATVHYGGFYHLGRTNKLGLMKNVDQAADGTIISPAENPIARYALHFHRAGNATQMGVVKGCAVVNSPGWGYVNHRSAVIIENNVAYNVSGASFISEAGDEEGTFKNNISIRTIGNGNENFISKLSFVKSEEKSFFNIANFGSAGDGFWMQSRLVEFENNVASGFTGNGFMMWNEFIDGIAPPPEEIEPPSLQKALYIKNNISYGGFIGYNLGFVSEAMDGGKNQLINQIIYNVDVGFRRKYDKNVVIENAVLIGDINHPKGDASKSHSNGSNFIFLNPHAEGFIGGLDFEHRGTVAGILEGGYFNNVNNLRVNIRHDRGQNVIFNKDIEFGELSPQALANVMSDNIEGFDGNQYNVFGYLDIASKDDDGFIDDSPPSGEGAKSNMVIQQADGTYRKTYLKTEQHENYIPWTVDDGKINVNWLDKTNKELQDLYDAPETQSIYKGSVLSGEYYDVNSTEVPSISEKYFNVVLGPKKTEFPFIEMYVRDSVPDIQLKNGESFSLDISNVVFDPNSFGVNYTIESNSNPIIADVELNGNLLVMTGLTVGETIVSLRATNVNVAEKHSTDVFKLNIIDSNVPLNVVNDDFELTFNESIQLDVVKNDIYAAGLDVSLVSVSQGLHGGVVAILDSGMIAFSPSSDFIGQDTFTYTIEDVYGSQSTGTVTINVNSLTPNYSISVEEGQSVEIKLADQVANTSLTNHGEIIIQGDVIKYTQTGTSHNGLDEFTYSIGESQGTVVVEILPETIVEDSFPAPKELFYEGFESSGFLFNEWSLEDPETLKAEVISPDTPIGAYNARLRKGTYIKNEFSSIGYQSVVISYYRMTVLNEKVLNEETGEKVSGNYFEPLWSLDGVNWEPLEARIEDSQNWTFVRYEFPEEANDKLKIYILFDVESAHFSEKAWLDEILVTGDPLVVDEVLEPIMAVGSDGHQDEIIFSGGLGDSPIESLYIKNTGNADLVLENFHISDNNFHIISKELPERLKPDNTAQLKIRLSEVDEVIKSGILTFDSNDKNSLSYSVNLESYFETLGILDQKENEGITIYPNPSYDGMIKIIGIAKYDIFQLQVVSTNGKILKSLNSQDLMKSIGVDLSELNPGVYFIRIKSRNGVNVFRVVLNI